MRRLSLWVDARSAPVTATVLIVAGGLVYTVLWSALARHGWQSVSDLWNSAGLALAIGHGHWAAVYAPGSQLDSPPGFEFLLAPVMVVGHAVGFHTAAETRHGYPVFWLVLAPAATVMASSVVFAVDAVARDWRIPDTKRLALSLTAGLGVVSAVVFWGHPEDCIALTFVVWAARGVDRSGPAGLARCGWLLGLAVACQPLALLAVAPIVARFEWRELRGVAWRLALPSAVVVLPELMASAHRTLHAIITQPFSPVDESSTPLRHLARSLGHGMYSGGTLRLVATVAAVLVGYVACRHRHDLPFVLWVMALAFTLRVLLESELLGFYFFPVVAISLLLTVRRWSSFGLCTAASIACLVLGNRREHAITLWWPAIMATTWFMLVLAFRAVSEGEVARPPAAPIDGYVAKQISHVRLIDG